MSALGQKRTSSGLALSPLLAADKLQKNRSSAGLPRRPHEPQFPKSDRQFVSLVSTTNTARSLAGFDLLALALTRCFSRQSYFTGIRTGASLSLSKTTKNLAGIVLLALRPTV
jgi:hypothetical protein